MVRSKSFSNFSLDMREDSTADLDLYVADKTIMFPNCLDYPLATTPCSDRTVKRTVCTYAWAVPNILVTIRRSLSITRSNATVLCTAAVMQILHDLRTCSRSKWVTVCGGPIEPGEDVSEKMSFSIAYRRNGR